MARGNKRHLVKCYPAILRSIAEHFLFVPQLAVSESGIFLVASHVTGNITGLRQHTEASYFYCNK